MTEGNDLLDTIEAAHAAALDESLWPAALGRLARLFGAAAASLEDFGKEPFGLRYFRSAGLPPQAQTDYLADYQTDNPRAEYAFRNLSQPILCDYVLIDERAMDRDAFYAKYLKALDLRYFMSGQIMDTPDAQAIVSIQRSRRQGHVEARDTALLRRLLPHVRQAYDVSLRVRRAAGAVRTFEHLLDRLADGVAIVRADGRIVHANEAFLALARRGDGLAIRRGVVEFAAGRPSERFARAVGAVARLRAGDLDGEAAADFLLPRRHGRAPCLVSIRPLPRDAGGAATAVMFVRDPQAPGAGTARTMREVYGFTEAEASLAEALCAGTPPGAYARARKLSMNTVYTHLRRIREKTGANRLPDLIGRLNDLRVLPRRG
jgi:DNA-binding CsgD family transcriptional regulator/PAS domain-containing protein